MARHKKQKKQRTSSRRDEETARRTFLDALEAQRANARSKAPATCAEIGHTAARGAPLAGFSYDEHRDRYFRTCADSERRHWDTQLEAQEQERPQIVERRRHFRCPTRRRCRYGVVDNCPKNWVAALSHRQKDWTWSAFGRDRSAFLPQVVSKLLTSQVVDSHEVETSGRLTALALHSRDSKLGAVGASSGRVKILGMQTLSSEAGLATRSQLAYPICDFTLHGVITSLQWRPVRELELLVCHLGSGQRSGSQVPSGNVCFLRVHDRDRSDAALSSMACMKRMKFVDPWTAKWNPTDTNKFSVGCGGSSSAAYVDAFANTDNFQRAPTGVLTSDVHAQSFFNTGHVVLNGTKRGGLWGWDIRAPRRGFEWEAETCTVQPAGSILDIHVLNDCRRAVVQRSNGELRVVDLRTFRPVVEFMQGATKRYLPSLRCAIDSDESIVVSAGDAKYPQAVNSFDLQSGRRVGSFEVQRAQSEEQCSPLVQQVQLQSHRHGNCHEDTPHLWAISRDALYVSSGRTNDPTM